MKPSGTRHQVYKGLTIYFVDVSLQFSVSEEFFIRISLFFCFVFVLKTTATLCQANENTTQKHPTALINWQSRAVLKTTCRIENLIGKQTLFCLKFERTEWLLPGNAKSI